MGHKLLSPPVSLQLKIVGPGTIAGANPDVGSREDSSALLPPLQSQGTDWDALTSSQPPAPVCHSGGP